MLEVAEIFRLHGESFRATHSLGPWELKAMADVEHCRTAYFGGHVQRCDRCGHERHCYHSCRNRHCPKCHGQQTEAWLQKHQERLLPVCYYLLTFTLPASLRLLAKNHPRRVYPLLMRAAVSTLQKLASDPQWVGGKIPVLAVLHTWTRAMIFHPHVHLLVPAGAVSAQKTWVHAVHPKFLVPGFALSKIFRAKFKAGLRKLGLLQPNAPCWKQKWNVHCRHAGRGQQALSYLARYVFRIAISNSRLVALHNGQVTFRYRDNKTQQLKSITLAGAQFIERFLQHVLPKGFVKVRSYGLWSAAQRDLLLQIRQQTVSPPAQASPATSSSSAPLSPPSANSTLCPHCKVGHMNFIQELAPQRKWPP